MSDSEIFNDYAKIALEQGLIKEAQEKDSSNSRYSAVDLEAIEMLYGVKPNGDEEHIVEQAHPNPTIVAPAYDRINGLVENLLERQDVMADIALKPNDGKHTNERYVKAHNDLLNELLKTAFLLDKKGEDDLMSLADSCADRLTKNANPIGLAGGIAIAGVAAWAIFGLVNNFGGMMDKGVSVNADRAIEELEDIVQDAGVMPGQTEDLRELIDHIREVKGLNNELIDFTVSKDKEQMQDDVDKGQELLSKYVEAAKLLGNEISAMLSVMEVGGHEKESWMSKYIGDFGVALEKTWGFLWGDEIKDAKTILETLRDSLFASMSEMRQYFNAVKSHAQRGDADALDKLLNPTEPSDEPEGEKPVEDVDELTQQLMS